MTDKPRRRAEDDYRKAQKAEGERYETLTRLRFCGIRHERIVIRRYYKLEYKAVSWKSLTIYTLPYFIFPIADPSFMDKDQNTSL